MRKLVVIFVLGCQQEIVTHEPCVGPLAPASWCPLEASPKLPSAQVEDRDQVLDLTLGDRFVLPANPGPETVELVLPLPPVDGGQWPSPVELVAPILLQSPSGTAIRYRIVREGGTPGNEIALFGAPSSMTPCVSGFFHLDRGYWWLGMNSGQMSATAGVIPGMDAWTPN